jgi:hypothetical protein
MEAGGSKSKTLRELLERRDLLSLDGLIKALGRRFLLVLSDEFVGQQVNWARNLAQTILDDTADLGASDALERTVVFPLPLERGGQDVVYVGRLPNNGVSLPDGSVSSAHAVFKIGPADELCLHDLQSTNGTWVAEKAVPAEGEKPALPIDVGDTIRFGNVRSVLLDAPALHRLLTGQT